MLHPNAYGYSGAYPPGVWLRPHAGVFASLVAERTMTAPRAMFFVDGNNWYHSLREAGVTGTGQLNYAKVCEKLAGPGREWIGTRYYIGRVNQGQAPALYADQRSFLAFLAATDPRITHYLGRLETRKQPNDAAIELRKYLGQLQTRIDTGVFHDLMGIAKPCHR